MTDTNVKTLKLKRTHAIGYCWRITSIKIAASVQEIKNNTFSNVTGLKFLLFEHGSIFKTIDNLVS